MNGRIYLDHNASAPLRPAAGEAVLTALEVIGNASSVHHEGRQARRLVENARRNIAAAVGARAEQVILTSGASEAAAHVLSPILRRNGETIPVSRLYASAIEHPCVLAGGRFPAAALTLLPVSEAGVVDLNALETALAGHDPSVGGAMVAVMLANNETGIVQPVERIAEITRRHNAYLVVDAVQALGRLPVDIAALGADFLLLSSHKLGGPKGAGAVVLGDAGLSPAPLITGGGQENFHRAGTENLAAIAGFAAASCEIDEDLAAATEIAAVRDSIEQGIDTICKDAGNKAGEPVFFGRKAPRLVNTSCFAVPGIRAETALIALDLAGIAVSAGSACSSGKVNKSHVLSAMGIDDLLAGCALRISIGPETPGHHAERFLGTFKDIVGRAG